MSGIDVLAVLGNARVFATGYSLTNSAEDYAEASSAVAELIEATQAAHMALIGYLPENRNAVTDEAISKVRAALARCRGGVE